MATRRMVGWAVLGLGLAVAGCQEPTQIVTVTPPGAVVDKVPESETGDNAPQALGEQIVPKGSSAPEKPVPLDIPPAPPTAKGEVKTTTHGVKYETLKAGTGAEVKPGDEITVDYVGTLDDGKPFDANRGAPFTIGVGKMIQGFDEAVVGMRVGEKRKLTIPPELGYKAVAKGGIPANSTLHFEVEVISIKSESPAVRAK